MSSRKTESFVAVSDMASYLRDAASFSSRSSAKSFVALLSSARAYSPMAANISSIDAFSFSWHRLASYWLFSLGTASFGPSVAGSACAFASASAAGFTSCGCASLIPFVLFCSVAF